MKKTGWIILGVIVVLVLWVFSGYNGLVEKQEQATTELANVQTQYQRRADMMPQLAKIVKAYAKHEKETFEAVTKARAAVGQVKLDASNLTEAKLKEYTAAQGELANAFSKLMVVAEKYPEFVTFTPKISKTDVKTAVKSGKSFDGADIIEAQNIQIK